jgi:uncharacterized protein (TIGR02145 family)
MKTHLYLSAFVLFFSFSVAHAQNKKEQIVLLNQTVDSLSSEIKKCEGILFNLKEQNTVLNKDKDSLITVLNLLKSKFSDITEEFNIVKNDNINLNNKYNESLRKIDSLKDVVFNKEHVNVGNQIWCNNNLKTHKFNNGDPINEAKTPVEWVKFCESNQPCFAKLPNNEYLYNGFVLSDNRGICPVGYKIPSNSDFLELISFAASNENDLSKVESIILDYEWYIETLDYENGGGIKDSLGIGMNKFGLNIGEAGFILPIGGLNGFELPSSFMTAENYEHGFDQNDEYEKSELFAACTYFWTSTKSLSWNSSRRHWENQKWENQKLNNVIDFGWCSQDGGGSMNGEDVEFSEFAPEYGFSIRLLKVD